MVYSRQTVTHGPHPGRPGIKDSARLRLAHRMTLDDDDLASVVDLLGDDCELVEVAHDHAEHFVSHLGRAAMGAAMGKEILGTLDPLNIGRHDGQNGRDVAFGEVSYTLRTTETVSADIADPSPRAFQMGPTER